MRLPALVPLAVMALLAGCSSGSGGGMGSYFPDEDDLPQGWSYAYGPRDDDGSAFSRSSTPPEKVRVAGLAGPGGVTGSIVVVRYDEAGQASRVANAAECDGDDLFRVLHDGKVVVFLGLGTPDASTQAGMRAVADRIERDNGATRAC